MAHKTWRISNCVLTSAISLLFATAAHGAVYPAHFDPPGNGTFIPGFTGDAVFDIPDSCLGEGWKPTSGSGGCGTSSMVSAITYLYSTSLSEPRTPGTELDQFILGSFPVLGVLAVGGQIAGVDTDPMGSVPGGAFYSGNSFWLQFVSGFCPGSVCVPIPFGGETFLTSVTGDKAPGDPAFIFVDEVNLLHRSAPANVIFGPACPDPTNCVVVPSAVPEPGILGLILAALGGGWLARRRKPPA